MEDDTQLRSFGGIIDALLREPGSILNSRESDRRFVTWTLLAIAVVSLLLYGLIAGTFSGGAQLLAAPVKIVGSFIISAAICFPSYYIFTCLGGSREPAAHIATSFVAALTLGSVLLAGFAPITWLFGQSTESIVFMGILHLLFVFFALLGAFSLFSRKARTDPERGRSGFQIVWNYLFLLVVCQMTTTMRPIIGQGNNFLPSEKRFFLEYWTSCLNGPECKLVKSEAPKSSQYGADRPSAAGGN